MNTKVIRHIVISFLLLSIVLSACSNSPSSSVGTQAGLASPTAVQEIEMDSIVKRTYHSILMVERATDLILAVIQKTQTGELTGGDAAPVHSYTDAFSAALVDFNVTTPPPGPLNHAWEVVSQVTGQYSLVTTALIQGNAISANDLVSLRIMRQLLTNYQSMAEGYLKRRGLGPVYFSSQFLAVEKHLQKYYGDKPVPASTN